RANHAGDVAERARARAPLLERPGRLALEVDDHDPRVAADEHLAEVEVPVMTDRPAGVGSEALGEAPDPVDRLAPARGEVRPAAAGGEVERALDLRDDARGDAAERRRRERLGGERGIVRGGGEGRVQRRGRTAELAG